MGLAERDLTIVQIGDNPSRLAAMKSNAIQASVFTTPNTCARTRRPLAPWSMPTSWGQLQGSGIAANGAFLRDHRPIVEQFVKGFLEGVAYAKTHKEENLPLIKEFMKLRDQDEVEDSYQAIIRDVQPRKPYPLKKGWRPCCATWKRRFRKRRAPSPRPLDHPTLGPEWLI